MAKKFLEIIEVPNNPSSSDPPGIYYVPTNGQLWVVANNSITCISSNGNLNALIGPYVLNSSGPGMDFKLICKFIAIGSDVNNAKLFAEQEER